MRPQDDNEMLAVVKATGEIYGKQVSVVAATMFLADLAGYTSGQVKEALHRCRKELRTFPSVADVVARIDDGRPGVEEAWAALPKSESDSTVWTEEMAQAFGVCRGTISSDPIAARMAFKEVYTRLVAEARSTMRPVVWTPSLGHDPNSRAAALEEAVRLGRLAIAQATSLTQEQLGAGQRGTTGIEALGDVVKRRLEDQRCLWPETKKEKDDE